METLLLHFLNHLAGQFLFLDILIIFLATYLIYGWVAFLVGWLFYLLIKKNHSQKIKAILISFLSGVSGRLLIVELIRWLYPRPRPFVDSQVYQLIEHSASPSFPSGHLVFFFALNTTLFLLLKKRQRPNWLLGLFVLAGLLIGLARIAAGLHYPSDVLAGLVIGLCWGWLVFVLFRVKPD